MEEVTFINIEEKEHTMKANFAMVLTHARMNGGKTIIKIGAYKCLIKILESELINEIDE